MTLNQLTGVLLEGTGYSTGLVNGRKNLKLQSVSCFVILILSGAYLDLFSTVHDALSDGLPYFLSFSHKVHVYCLLLILVI